MSANDLYNLIEALTGKAETGEQWAEICRLETLMASAERAEGIKAYE